MKRAPFLLAAIVAASTAQATTWYVNTSGDDAGAGDQPGVPLRSIGAAVARAAAGDEIRVAGGTYAETVVIDARTGLVISGGWDLAFVTRDPAAQETVVVGDPAAPVFSFSGGTGYLLEGVTVREGFHNVLVASTLPADQPVTLTVSDCTVTASVSYGIYSQGAWLVVDRSRIVANGQDGIAAHAPYETNRADITRNLIVGNGARYPSGGLYLISSRPYRIHNNVIARNNGWGVWIAYWGATAQVFNNTIVENTGGGVGTGYYKNMWIQNNVIAFNGAPGVNNVQRNWIGGDYNDVFGNVGGDYFQASPGPNDLSVDPGLDANDHLTAASPLVNAGADLTDYLADDLDGDPRTLAAGGDGSFDIGADEYRFPDTTPPAIAIDTPAAGGVYLLGEPVIADWTASDASSGLAWATGTVASGAPVDTATIGTKEFRVDAEDRSGNATSKVVSYDVRYGFGGFLPPLRADGTGTSRLGAPLVVKILLFDWAGLAVPGAVAQLFVAPQGGAEAPAVPMGGANVGNLFRYDPLGQQYVYNLSARTMAAGTWQLRVALDDGTSHVVAITIR